MSKSKEHRLMDNFLIRLKILIHDQIITSKFNFHKDVKYEEDQFKLALEELIHEIINSRFGPREE